VIGNSKVRHREQMVSRRPVSRSFAAVAVLLVFAVASSLALAGTHFYYCEAMGLTRSDPCQASQAGGARNTAPAVRESYGDCCQKVTFPSAPVGARAADHRVPPAPLATVVVPAAFVEQVHCAAGVRAPWALLERWRHPRRPASEVCAQLMVFLT
jgi:hypothetical protein